mgnify:CR=1 FL=1
MYTIWLPVVFSILFVIVCVRFGARKGEWGEKKVAKILKKLPIGYITINDVLLPLNGEKTTQIDHIVVSEYGIFVIETKNYSGRIYGGENTETWTKNVYGNKYSMPNPIRQNKLHISAVVGVLNSLHIASNVYSIVAFSPYADISAVVDYGNIVYFEDLPYFILRYDHKQLAIEQVQAIAQKLQNINLVDKKQREAHVRDVRASLADKEYKIENGICPRCGGRLMRRSGMYGSFYGCSNYPKCKFTTK